MQKNSEGAVVDRQGRDAMIQLIVDIASGKISWKKIYKYPRSKDRVIGDLMPGLVRYFSDGLIYPVDFDEGFLNFDLLFLKSDLEYEWPLRPKRPWLIWEWVVGSSTYRSQMAKWSEAGDIKVYPFFRRADYDRFNNKN